MAITVNIYYIGKDAKKFVDEMLSSGVVDEIRAEEGNLRYEYFLPYDGADTVLLIDSWKDQDSLDRHHASKMMQSISALREKYDLHMRAERYVSEDFSQADKSFIRK